MTEKEKREAEDLEKAMNFMRSNLDRQDDGKVGIFWYDIRNNELFGVHIDLPPLNAKANSSYGYTTGVEHSTFWKKQYNKLKVKNDGIEIWPFSGDYKEQPRGRIFYVPNEDLFVIYTGKWMNDYPDAKLLILDEFDLNNSKYEFRYGYHWDIGVAWR
jgi:hypothetical protein